MESNEDSKDQSRKLQIAHICLQWFSRQTEEFKKGKAKKPALREALLGLSFHLWVSVCFLRAKGPQGHVPRWLAGTVARTW